MKKKHKRIVVALIVFVMVFSNLKLPGSYASEIEQENIEDNSARVNKVETDEPIDFEFFERLGIYHIRNAERISVRTPGTWQYFSNGKRKYIHNDGSFTTNGWELIDGYWYFFDPSGFMYTGFVEDGGHVYYLEENANASNYGQLVKGWKRLFCDDTLDYEWFYFNQSGYMVTGWKHLFGDGSESWYYFGSNGVMRTGWQHLYDNGVLSWYYFLSNGKMKTGWLSYNNHWYFFKKTDGVMVTGWYNILGYTYYFQSNGQYKETTRRAIVISCAYFPSDIELMGWESCLEAMSFYEGAQFDQIDTRSSTSFDDFCDMIDDIKLDTEASDITYLCLTCHGDENGTLQFRYHLNNNVVYDSVTGQMLRNKLDQLNGKVVLFLNTCYAGTIINRGENEYPETAFITDFLGQSRSGELANDKYLVLCSSTKDEESAGYHPNGNLYVTIGYANKYWMLGGGWDVDTNLPTSQMNADTNPQNSIVTLNELYNYSSNPYQNQHVVVYPSNCEFTVFAKMDQGGD